MIINIDFIDHRRIMRLLRKLVVVNIQKFMRVSTLLIMKELLSKS